MKQEYTVTVHTENHIGLLNLHSHYFFEKKK